MHPFRYLSKARSLAVTLAFISLTSCHVTVKPTTVDVLDPVRHYYPIIRTEVLNMTFEITNTGEEPLVITDVLPSSNAIKLASGFPDLIPPGKTELLNLTYNSDYNIGYSQHKIRLYGNIYPDGVLTLTFDTHVIRPTINTADYEEIFFKKLSKEKSLVDGRMWEKGYWTDNQRSSNLLE